MKTINYIVVIALLLSFSCNKQNEILNPNETEQQYQIIYGLNNIPIIDNKQDINLLMTDPDDADSEKINLLLYKLSLATRDLVKNAEFNATIIKLARESENKTANLLLLEEIAPQFYDAINNNLKADNLSIKSIADNLTHAPVAPNPKFPET
jgi:hypothetical protein